jgi:hypothetical protein
MTKKSGRTKGSAVGSAVNGFALNIGWNSVDEFALDGVLKSDGFAISKANFEKLADDLPIVLVDDEF